MLLLTLPALAAPTAHWLATYQHRELLLSQGLGLLGGWALLNLLGSGYQLPRTDQRAWPHHFHFMNSCWGFINAILAAVGILRTHPGRPPLGLTPAGALEAQVSLERIFLFNAILDVGYMLVGLWLLSRAARPTAQRPERLFGYGRSLQLQGAFLLLFDVVMWLVVRH
ncbi:hypothetical protein GO988_07030 [Hymenobacter sp. HMF4947]|uniref:Uncharacterized protein n=1 Tax=Hymenobacter ginkgonis TaxID=2682976 RepID=A0A7K1TCH7_9BACT|nr:hypothetical protein [Hymenobacter ginkgonis]MVN76073.1 hypothetical protein [Hymenobacter ginkgonis]